jgi:hypothetical protein
MRLIVVLLFALVASVADRQGNNATGGFTVLSFVSNLFCRSWLLAFVYFKGSEAIGLVQWRFDISCLSPHLIFVHDY